MKTRTGERRIHADPARAAAWRDHLRGGGTTPWIEFTGSNSARGSANPGDPDDLLPGAQQLEFLRRVNLAGPPTLPLVHRILAADAVARGLGDLTLVGGNERRWGPPPVDPATLPVNELLRVGLGLLAHDLATRSGLELPPRWTVARVRAAVRRRLLLRAAPPSYRLYGDPLLVRAVRRQLVAAGRPPCPAEQTPQLVIILARPLAQMLGDVWRDGSFTGNRGTWSQWIGDVHAKDELPPALRLSAIAGAWRRRIGPAAVHVTDDPALVGDLLGTPAPDLTANGAVPSVTASDLARRLHGPLGLLVPPEERVRLLGFQLPWLVPDTRPAGGTPALPVSPEVSEWIASHAGRITAGLLRRGYSVDIGPSAADTAVPPGTPGDPAAGGRQAAIDQEVLDLTVRMLLDRTLRSDR